MYTGVLFQFQCLTSESIQSAKLSFRSSELGPPTPSHASECPPPLWVQGGETAAYGEVGWNGGPNSGDRTDTLVVLYYI
jgi:hypothetical protein